jgi:NAD-dependent DNA ligase
MSKILIEKLEKNPHEEGLKLKIDDLEMLLIKAIDAYYNSDQPLFTDSTYDILETILREKKPSSGVFKKVGAPVKTEDKIKLEYYDL